MALDLSLKQAHRGRHRSGASKKSGSTKCFLWLFQNFLYMCNGEIPEEIAIKTMDTAMVLHMDHGFNASTFTARVVTSSLSDMISAVTAAIGSLKGPLHGGANTAVMEMFWILRP